MGKQTKINSAKNLEEEITKNIDRNKTKSSTNRGTKTIKDYFSFTNKKRLREESSLSSEENKDKNNNNDKKSKVEPQILKPINKKNNKEVINLINSNPNSNLNSHIDLNLNEDSSNNNTINLNISIENKANINNKSKISKSNTNSIHNSNSKINTNCNSNSSKKVNKNKSKNKKDKSKKENHDDEKENQKPKKKKENSNICSICRDGGDLLLCDKCPKSFHANCLKIKISNLNPDDEWFCPACLPKVEKAKSKNKDSDEKRKLRNEKKKLWRLKKKEQIKNLNFDNFPLNKIPLISQDLLGKLSQEKKNFNDKEILCPNTFSNSKLNSNKKNIRKSINITSAGLGGKFPQNLNSSNSKNYMKEFFAKGKKENKINLENTFNASVAANVNNALITSTCSGKIFDSKNKNKKIDTEIVDLLNSSISSKSSKSLNESFEVNQYENDFNKKNPIEKTFFNLNNLNDNNINTNNENNANNSNNAFSSINKNDLTQNINLNLLNKQKLSKIQIKYPIDDYELYQNPEKYNLAKSYFNKPYGKSSLIPDIYYTKILKIWDLIDSFKTKFNLKMQIYPEDLYIALNYSGNSQLDIIDEIHISFLQIFYEELKLKQIFDFSDDKNTLMFKIAFEKCENKKENLKYFWVELLRIIILSSFFSLMVNEEIQIIAENLNNLKYNWEYNFLEVNDKIKILEFLCNTVLDTDTIRDIVKSEIEEKKELKEEVNNLEMELKSMDSRKKELERQEKFTQPKSKIESLTKRLDNLVQDNPDFSRMELTKLRKELEQEREQFKSVNKLKFIKFNYLYYIFIRFYFISISLFFYYIYLFIDLFIF
jgi:hypothetical protein